MSRRHAAALEFGAELVEPGRTRFSLWAPAAREVLLEAQGAPPLVSCSVVPGVPADAHNWNPFVWVLVDGEKPVK